MGFKEEIIKYEFDETDGVYIEKDGVIPIIFTAVHTMEQTRKDGSLKYSEPFTKGIALYVANKLDAFYYVKLSDTGIDSNSKVEDEFKINLLKIIKENNIKLLIDLHGARADREFDVEFGTLDHLTVDFSTIKELDDAFKEVGITRIAYNDPFKGGGITQYIYKNTDIDIIQIEINQNFRMIENIDKIEKICIALINFSKMYSNFN